MKLITYDNVPYSVINCVLLTDKIFYVGNDETKFYLKLNILFRQRQLVKHRNLIRFDKRYLID